MKSAVEIAKGVNDAFDAKDLTGLRNLLHPDYHCSGPEMEIHGPEQLIALAESNPVTCHSENVEYVAAGNKVIMTCDWVATNPVPFRNRMCDIMTVEEGKVLSEELFYDTAKIPQQVSDMMKQAAQRYQRAA